jgi:hypothetical protein
MFDQVIDKILAYFRQQTFDLMADDDFCEKRVAQYSQRLADCRYMKLTMEKKPAVPAEITGFVYSLGSITTHTVTIKQNGIVDCTCKNFIYRMKDTSGYCKHIITAAFVFAGSNHIEHLEQQSNDLNDPI